MLELFPESAAVVKGELTLGGMSTAELGERFGTPLVVYCERTLRSAVDAYRRAAPSSCINPIC